MDGGNTVTFFSQIIQIIRRIATLKNTTITIFINILFK